MPTLGERLTFAAALLAAPGTEAPEVLPDLVVAQPALAGACAELAALPLVEWQAEHGRLFISGHPRTPCLPFASVHLDGMMFGPTAGRIAAFYAELGLAADEASPDYLGTLLACAAWLRETARTEAEALLWRNYLLPWLPGFAAKLEEESALGLYRWLGHELAELAKLAELPHG